MKKYKILIAALLMAVLGLGGISPVFAADNDKQGTFEVTETGDTAEIRLGSNLFLAGNFINSDKGTQLSPVNGLLFAAGNQLSLKATSEYAFVAGNVVNYTGETERDLFIAGNIISILNEANIGRDVFAAGNVVDVATDLPGDLSITANKVVINGINIAGDLNVEAENIIIEGKVNVDGKFVVNSDANIDGIEKISYAEIEKYEVVEDELTATEILIAKIISIAGLFIAFTIVMAMFPAVKKRINKELNATQFGKDLVIGIVTLVAVPIIAIFLLISIIGAPAGILLLAAYIIIIYLSQGFTGLWLGKIIVEKLAHGKINDFLELLIGITVLALLVMIPWLGTYIGLLSLILGLGLFMQSIKPNRKPKQAQLETVEEAEVVKAETSAKPKKTVAKDSRKSNKDIKEEE